MTTKASKLKAGSESSDDAERRRAQASTLRLGKAINVSLPMMPKGVEHTACLIVGAYDVIVSLPMMPKGVEHALPDHWLWSQLQSVSLPMMPKGVEHILNGPGPFLARM